MPLPGGALFIGTWKIDQVQWIWAKLFSPTKYYTRRLKQTRQVINHEQAKNKMYSIKLTLACQCIHQTAISHHSWSTSGNLSHSPPSPLALARGGLYGQLAMGANFFRNLFLATWLNSISRDGMQCLLPNKQLVGPRNPSCTWWARQRMETGIK